MSTHAAPSPSNLPRLQTIALRLRPNEARTGAAGTAPRPVLGREGSIFRLGPRLGEAHYTLGSRPAFPFGKLHLRCFVMPWGQGQAARRPAAQQIRRGSIEGVRWGHRSKCNRAARRLAEPRAGTGRRGPRRPFLQVWPGQIAKGETQTCGHDIIVRW
jgi:hypothetical protein